MYINIGDILFGSRTNGHKTTDPIIRILVRIKYEDTCQICGRVYHPTQDSTIHFSRIEIDHIIPYSHGGRNHIRNYQLLCKECNRKKGSTLLEE